MFKRVISNGHFTLEDATKVSDALNMLLTGYPLIEITCSETNLSITRQISGVYCRPEYAGGEHGVQIVSSNWVLSGSGWLEIDPDSLSISFYTTDDEGNEFQYIWVHTVANKDIEEWFEEAMEVFAWI
jgi:hypothetical protein